MGLLSILLDSIRLLRAEPKIYLPRIFTTAIYTAFVLYTAKLSVELTRTIMLAQLRAEAMGVLPDFGEALSGFSGSLVFFLAFFLFAYAVDILSYGMYVRIVSDYQARRPIKLLEALKDALRRGKTLLALSLVILAFMTGIFILYLLLGSAFLLTRSALYPVLALLVLLAGLITFALIFFFSIPVAMTEGKGALNAVSISARLGFKHRGVVIKTNLVFAGLIFATLLVAMFTDFSGSIGAAAVITFAVGRLFQALVYTYISVVNPAVYLYLEEAR